MRTRQLIFFFNDTATTEIYTLSLHDALPICPHARLAAVVRPRVGPARRRRRDARAEPGRAVSTRTRIPIVKDRKSTRLNSSHANISYAVFCLKKKKIINILLDTKSLQRISQT